MSLPCGTAPIAVVIGGTGFLALELTAQLLSRGFTVHSTVRDLEDTDKNAPLFQLRNELCDGQVCRLRLFQATLDDPETFEAAFSDCSYIFHTAAPVPLSFSGKDGGLDPRAVSSVVRGASGIVRVAGEMRRRGGLPALRRIVFTSSAAAARVAPKDAGSVGGRPLYDESSWNNSSDPSLGGVHVYSFMKAESERAFWAAVEEYGLEGASVLPALIIGPSRTGRESWSVRWMKSWLSGRGGAKLPRQFTDVRDCATAHIEAAVRDAAKGQRYPVMGDNLVGFTELLEVVKSAYTHSNYDWVTTDPSRDAKSGPGFFVTTKCKEELSLTIRPWQTSIIEGLQSLIEINVIDY